jgi:hypothetical protein
LLFEQDAAQVQATGERFPQQCGQRVAFFHGELFEQEQA